MTTPRDTFTPREQEVMELIGAGMTYGCMANQLGVTEETVRKHARNAAAKLPHLSHLPCKAALAQFLAEQAA